MRGKNTCIMGLSFFAEIKLVQIWHDTQFFQIYLSVPSCARSQAEHLLLLSVGPPPLLLTDLFCRWAWRCVVIERFGTKTRNSFTFVSYFAICAQRLCLLASSIFIAKHRLCLLPRTWLSTLIFSTLKSSALTPVVDSVADKCCLKWSTYLNHLAEVTDANLLATLAKLNLPK